MEPFGPALRLRNMGHTRQIRMDADEARRLAGDCRRVAETIDEHVALLLTGGYGSVRGDRAAPSHSGYRAAVETVAGRLALRAVELRSAARGLTARAETTTLADAAAARRIAGIAAR